MLWLALYLPDFPLEITPVQDQTQPRLIYSQHEKQPRVLAANDAAKAQGIYPGLSLAAALALSQSLTTEAHAPQQQQHALERLALWAQQFTPVVSLQPPQGLLLEIGASLSLFHGLERLQESIAKEIQQLGYSHRQGVAPTPSAAWLLGLHPPGQVIREKQQLPAELAPIPLPWLPLEHWNLPPNLLDTLTGVGLLTLGDCLSLPRSALTQRTGHALANKLDQLLGQHPERPPLYQPPRQYRNQLLLPNTVENTAPLLFALQRLLRELSGFLRSLDSGAQHMTLHFIAPQEHRQNTPPPLSLKLIAPSRDSEHLHQLWKEKLDRYTLSSPVEGLQLEVEKLQRLDSGNHDLLSPRNSEQPSFEQFLDRLRTRLGNDALQQLHHHADHRAPHSSHTHRYASRSHAPTSSTPLQDRPYWLLDPPQRLPTRHTRPEHHGPLHIIHGPERLESGWWDGDDQRRDYYIARNPRHQTLWIYTPLKSPTEWYLHGLFS
ncbi:MAG: Y-family DNA polymerase [bacterium]